MACKTNPLHPSKCLEPPPEKFCLNETVFFGSVYRVFAVCLFVHAASVSRQPYTFYLAKGFVLLRYIAARGWPPILSEARTADVVATSRMIYLPLLQHNKNG